MGSYILTSNLLAMRTLLVLAFGIVASQGKSYLVETKGDSEPDYKLGKKWDKEIKNGGKDIDDMVKDMEEAGKEVSDEGIKIIKKLDTNGNGKLDLDDVSTGDEGDYHGPLFNINQDFKGCIGCKVENCIGTHGGPGCVTTIGTLNKGESNNGGGWLWPSTWFRPVGGWGGPQAYTHPPYGYGGK